jgi:carbon starvation protein
MVAGWGYILVLGVTDPLGGINTFFPLFGIANQLLAVIALSVVMAIVARRGNFRHLWVVVLPLGFAAVVTVTASMFKIFSPVPAVGYWAQNEAFRTALAEGRTSFGTAKSVEAMEAVVRNTTVQGTLSVVFVVLTLVVLVAAIVASVRAARGHRGVDTEDPRVESRIFAPAGLIPTTHERELQAEWDEVADRMPSRRH